MLWHETCSIIRGMAALASSAADSLGYVWEDPGDSIMIQVSLDLIERLSVAVQHGLGAGQRGTEIGGILLGRTLPGFARAVLIEDFELVVCEHLRGASYTLSPKDRRLLGSRLARHAPREVVGYFRSHTRPGMYLDQDDFAVFSQHFPESWQVFLLVAPSEDSATGGFFFWEEGDINRRSPYRQFPFDAARLLSKGFPLTGTRSVAQTVAPKPVSPKPVSPKTVSPRTEAIPGPAKSPGAVAVRKLPPLHWVVVPVIAVLFLIAGLFVSGNQEPISKSAIVKSNPPIEPLLPEPVAPKPAAAVAPQEHVNPPAVADAAIPAAKPLSAAPQPSAAPKPKKLQPALLAPPPVKVAKAAPRAIEQPPALAPAEFEPKVVPALTAVRSAPPLEAEVTYEAPRPGVFRRALHKIEGADSAEFAAAAPIRKVLPPKPAGEAAGEIDVKVSIDDAGNVTRAQAVTKNKELAPAALAAARQWRFTPARKHDKPVASEMLLHFRF